ncbi:MAG: trimethylamine methyltransferase family protein [Desulfobacterales bacterium]|nr:trimethylamine methyltransferase family protein [Desulfobacterales bacterium]
MINRLQTLSPEQVQTLHSACMDILSSVGVRFCDAEALEIFETHGFKVDGETVFFTESQVMTALETVPQEFTIHARNPEKSVTLGNSHFGLGPGWGAPFVVDANGSRRTASMADQEKFCKLVQTSPYLDFAAGSMAVPAELSPTAATSAMLGAAFTLTDLPVISNPCSRENADEIVEMATIAYGGAEALKKGPITIVSVNPLSPLTYTEEAAGGLINYARHGQALLISSMILAGISGPIDIAGTAVLEMSESLAGIVLAQLVNPGTPCVCGGTSCASDLRTGGVYLGGPEQLKFMAIATQMAEHYGLPCRYGGNLTDAWSINYQAGVESALALSNTLISGGHFIHQACGILGAYNAVSFEKFILDEEVCGLVKRSLEPVVIDDEHLSLDLIKKVGHGGNFMVLMETAMKCRTAFYPAQLAKRGTYEAWDAQSMGDNLAAASELVDQRIAAYVKPDNDPTMEKDIEKYVAAKAIG